MAIFTRYETDPKINLGTQLGTAKVVSNLRKAIRNGSVPIVNQFTTNGVDRLDVLAASVYGDSRFWWILAAASDIGWGLQVPPGTLISIVDLRRVEEVVT